MDIGIAVAIAITFLVVSLYRDYLDAQTQKRHDKQFGDAATIYTQSFEKVTAALIEQQKQICTVFNYDRGVQESRNMSIMVLLTEIERKEDIILEELKKAIADLKAAVNNVATRIQNQIENLKANATDATTVKDLAAQIEEEVAALNNIGATQTPATDNASTSAAAGAGSASGDQSGQAAGSAGSQADTKASGTGADTASTDANAGKSTGQ